MDLASPFYVQRGVFLRRSGEYGGSMAHNVWLQTHSESPRAVIDWIYM